jgi:FMN phosphatase YigB (HAD superfamily)
MALPKRSEIEWVTTDCYGTLIDWDKGIGEAFEREASEDGLTLDAGPFVAALEYASGKTALVVGKPEPAFFEAALRDLGREAHEVAMVGDDAESDVAGAQRRISAAGLPQSLANRLAIGR